MHNRVDVVPGYDDGWASPQEEILSAIRKTPSGPLNVIIDCLDTLSLDIGSISQTYNFLREVLALIHARQSTDPSRLILHAFQTSKLVSLLTQAAFSPSLISLTAHPSVLLEYLAREFLTPPPPASSDVKFWSVFRPVSERGSECDRLVFGGNGEGTGPTTEFVVEVLSRSLRGTKRSVERSLEGWSWTQGGACELTMLESLKTIWSKTATMLEHRDPPDLVQGVSFNLTLTSSQQQSRAQVPLPYVHEGKDVIKKTSDSTSAVIRYDPDSADDIDDDDPDEDLDI